MCEAEELSARERLGVLSFLMHFDIYIANNWQSNIDSKIKQIRSLHQGRRQSLFFGFGKGSPRATAQAYK